MKKRFALPVLAAVVVVASGCASTTTSSANLSPYGEYDEHYVAQVERIARRTGVDVYWYHLPQKRATMN